VPSARWGVTGGIEEAMPWFGSGSSTRARRVVVNVRTGGKVGFLDCEGGLESGYCLGFERTYLGKDTGLSLDGPETG
jgi:hypothetical protein